MKVVKYFRRSAGRDMGGRPTDTFAALELYREADDKAEESVTPNSGSPDRLRERKKEEVLQKLRTRCKGKPVCPQETASDEIVHGGTVAPAFQRPRD